VARHFNGPNGTLKTIAGRKSRHVGQVSNLS
jgi:hypothetical protein